MSELIRKPDDLTDKILEIERFIVEEMEPAEIEWVHRFAPGVYTREMIVPENVIMTGAIHKTEHISIFLEGEMLVPGDGEGKVIEAPIVEIAQPGVKRIGYAIEQVRWLTIHVTDETDIDVIEDMFFTNDPDDVKHLLDYEPQGYAKNEKNFAAAQRHLYVESKSGGIIQAPEEDKSK